MVLCRCTRRLAWITALRPFTSPLTLKRSKVSNNEMGYNMSIKFSTGWVP